MDHESLKRIKDALVCEVESQIYNLADADAKELGEAVDMIKDMEEAIYYCTITEAMKNEEHKEQPMYMMYYPQPMHTYADQGNGRSYFYDYMPYDEDRRYRSSDGSGQGSTSNMSSSGSNSSYMMSPMARDYREGRSPMSRKMYMEAKEHKSDKSSQLRELEKYMSELSQDVVEMIQDSTSEEKQYLEKKISALANKIGQMK